MTRQSITGCATRRRSQLLLLLALVTIIMMSACSRITLDRANWRSDFDERRYATFSLDMEDPHPTKQVNFYKVSKGYAVTLPFKDAKDYNADLMIMRNREYNWFAGVQWKYSF